mmetsp:Transcript_110673/g.308369  ORF Transcript_110673/g.308369 Transcript_110673/m.308369 type:complete len:244 (-) Transcript_110673:547-1278(-)
MLGVVSPFWVPPLLLVLVPSSAGGIEGGGASVMPFVFHEGSVVPRPRPAGPRETTGASSCLEGFFEAEGNASSSAGCADPAAPSPLVIHDGNVEARPRPAGPLAGDGDFIFFASFFSSSSLFSPLSLTRPLSLCPGGFQLTSIVFAPVLSLRKPPSSRPRSRPRPPLRLPPPTPPPPPLPPPALVPSLFSLRSLLRPRRSRSFKRPFPPRSLTPPLRDLCPSGSGLSSGWSLANSSSCPGMSS